MSYEKIREWVLWCRAMQEFDLDVTAVTTSPKGFGKSSLIIQGARIYIEIFGLYCQACNYEWMYNKKCIVQKKGGGFELRHTNLYQPCPKCGSTNIIKPKKINFGLYLAYDSDEVKEKIHELPEYSPLLPDEGVRFMMGEDWMKTENKDMKKLFAQMRTKHLFLLTNIQKFKWTDSKIRNDMTTFWIRILKRGFAILMQPDLGETDDPWHMKDFEKSLGQYFYMTPSDELLERAHKLKETHPCVFDYLSIPKVPDDIYADYLKIRNQKAFERKMQEDLIDQKQIAKIASWNIINNWDQVKGAVQMSRFDKPTFKILEEFVFTDPITSDHIVRYTTIRNYVNEIDKIVQKRKYKAI